MDVIHNLNNAETWKSDGIVMKGIYHVDLLVSTLSYCIINCCVAVEKRHNISDDVF